MKRNFLKCFTILALFVVTSGVAGELRAQTTSANDAETTYKNIFRVACVGDSITFGAGVSERDKNSYPALLGQWLGAKWEVRNFGVSGATLLKKGDRPYWKQRAYSDALQWKPDIVVIKLGTNDSKHPAPGAEDSINNWQYKADFAADYKSLLAEFRKVNPSVKIFTCLPVPAYPERWGINGATIREEIIPLTRGVAAESQAEVIDLHTALSNKPELFPDKIHPNNAGARLIAAEVYRSLLGKEPPSDSTEATVNAASNADADATSSAPVSAR